MIDVPVNDSAPDEHVPSRESEEAQLSFEHLVAYLQDNLDIFLEISRRGGLR